MSKRASVQSIEASIGEFVDGLPEMEKHLFDRVYAILKELSVDSEGKIKPTISNLKLISSVEQELETIVDDPKYQDKVFGLKDAISEVKNVQTTYYKASFEEFDKEPGVVKQYEKQAFESTVDDLTEAGIKENVINDASEIVEQHIRDGMPFSDLVETLKERMISRGGEDSKLVSYAKQTINDTLSGFGRNYHKIVTSDLGLEWFEYVGTLVEASRPFCIGMVKKHYIHVSELGKAVAGGFSSPKGSKEGMMKGTTKDNVVDRCGGWNCNHQLVPVPASSVPSNIRRKITPDVELDSEEQSETRPKRKR
jgi:hypothetical protein